MHLEMSCGKWRPFCLGLNEWSNPDGYGNVVRYLTAPKTQYQWCILYPENCAHGKVEILRTCSVEIASLSVIALGTKFHSILECCPYCTNFQLSILSLQFPNPLYRHGRKSTVCGVILLPGVFLLNAFIELSRARIAPLVRKGERQHSGLDPFTVSLHSPNDRAAQADCQ